MATKKAQAKVKYTAFVAASIDGRIAKDEKSGTNWTSSEDWKFFQKSLSKMDAVIAGTNTYKVVGTRLNKRNTIILTSKVSKVKIFGSVAFLNPKKDSLKKFIKHKKYKSVGIVGGSHVYNFCLESKMLDELFVTVEPYVFGSGVPMFSGTKFKKHKFILESVKKLNKKGTILLRYKYAG
jgi:dihydrofolate reductase